MDVTEDIGRAPVLESSDRTPQLLRDLAECPTDAEAIRLSLQRAREAVEAELSVYADGDLTESSTSEAALVVPVRGRLRGHLVLARPDRPFTAAEHEEIEAIARALSLFEPGADLLDRLTLQDELAAALRGDGIQAYFLPKADLRTARVIGVEALARWAHRERGMLQPADFLDLAESGGLMPLLTSRVLDLAIRAAGDWWRSGLRLEISVNLPAASLAAPDPELAEAIASALEGSEIPADALRFDIPENALLAATDPAPALGALAELGASISIDDFGTAHTSLTRLKRLGIDELKIDRSFIRALSRGGDRALVRSTVHLGRQLGLRIVAEGVDTDEAWRQLRGVGCDAAQGFLIGAPLPAREFLAWIASWNTRGRELNSLMRKRLEVAKPPGETSLPTEKAPA
jgi:EAL domain-containing protein (putative c-di-GMP-specific phosphodiesterase class I)